jgi:hypothetical protein
MPRSRDRWRDGVLLATLACIVLGCRTGETCERLRSSLGPSALMVGRAVGLEPPPREKLPACASFDTNALAERVAPDDAELAARIRDPAAKFHRVETGFLRAGAIFEVELASPHPIVEYVGCEDGGDWAALTGDPAAFAPFAKRAGLSLAIAEERLAYLSTYLVTTRPGRQRLELLERFDDLRPRPHLDGPEAARFQTLRREYSPRIRRLAMSADDSWQAAMFAVRDQALVRVDLVLRASGEVQAKETVLERRMPIACAN